MAGGDDPRSHSAGLLRRALAGLLAAARSGGCGCAPTGGYFAGELARAALFAASSSRSAPK